VLLALTALAAASASAWPGSTRAEWIPPGAEERVVRLIRPFGIEAPDDQVAPGVVLSAIAIEKDSIRFELAAGAEGGSITLRSASDTVPSPDRTTRSFKATLDAAARSGALRTGADALLSAISANDDGTFWKELPVPAEVGRTSPAPEVSEGLGPADFVGEALLVLLLALLFPARAVLVRTLRGQPRYLWLGALACVALAATLRLVVLPAGAGVSPLNDKVCSSAVHCDDFNGCTRDECVDQMCVSTWAPPPGGGGCCLSDSDCPPSTDPCIQVVCDPDTNRCADRTTCRSDPYGDQSRPPLDGSVGWLLAIPAKWVGNTTDLARLVNSWASSLSALLVPAAGLAWGMTPAVSLAGAFLWSVYPASLAAALGASMTGILAFLVLLLLALWGVLMRGEPGGRQRRCLEAAAALVLFLLTTARPEYAALLLPLAVAPVLATANRKQNMTSLVAAGAAALLALILGAVLRTGEAGQSLFPDLAAEVTAFVENTDTLFVSGLPVPFLLLLLSLAGIRQMLPENRPLALTLLSLFPLLVLQAALVTAPAPQIVRLSLVPGLLFVFLGASGLRLIAGTKVRFAWLAVLTLLVYFALFPLQHRKDVQTLGSPAGISSTFYQP
jgi:hypothetical protein